MKGWPGWWPPHPWRRCASDSSGRRRAGCVDNPSLALAEFEREWHRVSDFLNAADPD
jgi:hypothetical protein